MIVHAPRRKVFDLTRQMRFRRGDATEVVQFDALERMIGNVPIGVDKHRAVDGLVLFDRRSRIAHC